MLEFATDTRHRDAIRAAHAARGAVVAGVWTALFARTR
jgi:hypothetical protein